MGRAAIEKIFVNSQEGFIFCFRMIEYYERRLYPTEDDVVLMGCSMQRAKIGWMPLAIALTCVAVSARAESASRMPLEHVVAQGGKTVYYIMQAPGRDAMGDPNMTIEAGTNENRSFHVFLKSKPSNDPAQNLTNFSKLSLSPDGKTLYFEASAWATSPAVHAIDLSSGRVSFITAGGIACIVLSGEYQGHLVVEKHRYFVQGGSYDSLYLVDPTGKELGIVSLDTDAGKVCPSLGN